MSKREREDLRTRAMLVQACARIMAVEGVMDFRTAKRKASQRVGWGERLVMPSNSEIQAALLEYQRLYQADSHAEMLLRLRVNSVKAIRFFSQFNAKLVGAVLDGTAVVDSDIQLHLFADTPEDVRLWLMQNDIPVEEGRRKFKRGKGRHVYYPTFVFGAGEVNVDITVFPYDADREAPISSVDGRPMRRAGLPEIEALCATD